MSKNADIRKADDIVDTHEDEGGFTKYAKTSKMKYQKESIASFIFLADRFGKRRVRDMPVC